MKWLKKLIRLFYTPKPKPLPKRYTPRPVTKPKGYGYRITDEMFNKPWGGKCNDVW